jgi:hypothetical protein
MYISRGQGLGALLASPGPLFFLEASANAVSRLGAFVFILLHRTLQFGRNLDALSFERDASHRNFRERKKTGEILHLDFPDYGVDIRVSGGEILDYKDSNYPAGGDYYY